MKFPGYMLIVWDFVKSCKDMKIPVGPGRGSAAGSLVAYSLKLQILTQFLMDYFLRDSKSREGFNAWYWYGLCQSRRGEIIDYVVNQYGRITLHKLLLL